MEKKVFKGIRAALITSLAVLALLVLVGCANNNSPADADAVDSTNGTNEGAGTKTLTVAMELAYPPFETKDDAGNPSGLSVDFIKDFGAAYGYEVIIENTAWDGLIPSLQTGKADCIISSMTITDERKEVVDFSEPYAKAQLAILANSNSGIASMQDFDQPGRKLAVKTGSTGDKYATDHLTDTEIIRLADESACVTEVIQGKADGFIYDQLTIYRNQQSNPDTTAAIYIPFQDVEYWGVAVKKGDTALLSELNEFIAQSKSDGEFDRLTEKHLAAEKEAFDRFGFTWFFDFE
ncbi:MAG: transporter substrate-binding domain-containing protein [Coriobacteriales bacterium]|jgi:polar amino acid transport system substrate-binding protein|nr:transporter substrate-binding domain-containing protein [Coriobacteriales bacterium]